MVKNIKIKYFLILSFVILFALMAILGIASLYFISKGSNELITFNDYPHTVQLEVGEIRLLMSGIDSKTKDSIIAQDTAVTNETIEYINNALEDMNRRITIVKERFIGDQQPLLEADAAVEGWLGGITMLDDVLLTQDYDKAREFYNNTYVPLNLKLDEAVQKVSDVSTQQTQEFYESAQASEKLATIVVLGMLIFTLIVTVIIARVVTYSIALPLRLIREASEAMSQGDLHHHIDFEGKNEFGSLARSMRHTMDTLSTYVENIDDTLHRMSNKDMTVVVELDYIGDFAPIKKSMEQILLALNSTLSKIGDCSDMVASGADLVSDGSQTLSQGATEQASSVEEISANIAEVSAQVQENAASTNEARALVDTVGSELASGNQKMQQMLIAINEINTTSDQIGKIIKTIEDIAFQTNILALNAAVEAARAGAAGKGFAVVADEVRNLASKSAEAAKNTTALIESSIKAVENGTKIADETANSLKAVVSGAAEISSMIAKITAASSEQANSLVQVAATVDQISSVIQNNSATSEESAAASEELNSQSQMLMGLVKQFKLTTADKIKTADTSLSVY